MLVAKQVFKRDSLLEKLFIFSGLMSEYAYACFMFLSVLKDGDFSC